MTDRITLAAPHSLQEHIRKSRFLACAAPIGSADEAMDFFAQQADPGASHNCWAYRLGQHYRFNDDGEPAGTAGKPILLAIDGQGLDGVAVLVVRWFGGIKLGAGGLMRAYGGCAAQCLRAAPKLTQVALARGRCHCDYADLARFKARMEQAGARIDQEDFTAQGAWLTLAAPRDELAAIEILAADLTRGRGGWERL